MRISTNVLLYLGNDTKYDLSYCGMLHVIEYFNKSFKYFIVTMYLLPFLNIQRQIMA